MDSVLALLQWLRSEGVTVYGIGMQWHIKVSAMPKPNDLYYQTAQRIVDNGFEFIVTELDVAILMKGSQPKDPCDEERQGLVYRALVKYVLQFVPTCLAFITWGFTDRHSWLPSFSNYVEVNDLPFDWKYQPKLAYWQLQEELNGAISDGVYRLELQ